MRIRYLKEQSYEIFHPTRVAMRTIPLFKEINKEVVPEVAGILAKCLPEHQARWHKGAAGVTTSHAMVCTKTLICHFSKSLRKVKCYAVLTNKVETSSKEFRYHLACF